MKKLERLIKEVESKISWQLKLNKKVSESSVGWHIEHSLLTIDAVTEALKKSEPEKYKPTFSFAAAYVFITGNIPRGRTQSPNTVRPKNNFNVQSLREHIKTTTEKTKFLELLQGNKYFNHPVFGKLNSKAARKFLFIHTRHHLKIINDIIVK